MKWKAILLFGILMVVDMASADLASDLEALSEPMPEDWNVVWKDNCQIRCVDGKCNQIIGRTFWVNDSDNKCKPIEQANSLKNGFFVEYLEIDPSFNLIVSDFNISFMDMTLDFKGNPADYPNFCQVTDELNAKCDFKIDEKWNEVSQLKFQYKWEMKKGVVIKGDKIKYEYKQNPFGKKFSFGGNSTTIQLQDADTENLDDAYVNLAAPDFAYGTTEYMMFLGDSNSAKKIVISFNLTSIPSSQDIDKSELFLYMYSEGIDTGEAYNAYVCLYDTSWSESTLTWNNMDMSSVKNCSNYWLVEGADPNPDAPNWINWTVTSLVSSAYNEGLDNVSLVINASLVSGSPSTSDDIDVRSKEYTADTSLRPYLNITYSMPTDSTPPTYSDNSTNSTKQGQDILHSLKWEDEVELSSYIFSFHNGSNSSSCVGTLDCSQYSTETSCENCSQCTWESAPGDYTSQTCDSVWGFDCSAQPDSDNTHDDCPTGTSSYMWVSNIYLNSTDIGADEHISIICEMDPYTADTEEYIYVKYPNASWEQLYSGQAPGGDLYNISPVTFSTTSQTGTYWIRCISDWDGESDECAGGSYYDNDDINFTVVSGNVCSNDGSCGACPSDECDTNCSAAGCSIQTIEFVNDTAVSFSGTLNWSNVTKIVSSNVGDTIKWCIHTNDTTNNWNSISCVSPFSYVIKSAVDTIPPTYSDNKTNSTVANTTIKHSLKWTDEEGLAISGGHIFSFDNGTGNLVNDSWVAFSSNPDWSNITKTVNSTEGATIRWCIYANDTSDNWNNTGCETPFSYDTTEAPPEDSCDCPASGESLWTIQCSDNCDIQLCDRGGNNVLINGSGGNILSLRNITNATRIRIQGGCIVRW